MSEVNRSTELNAAFEKTGVKFNDRAATLAAFKADHPIGYDDEGQPITVYDGVLASLDQALLKFALDNRTHVDGRTLPPDSVETGRPKLTSKSDFTTVKEKSDFIHQNGFDEWEKLARSSQPTVELKTRQQWNLLSSKEKSRLIGLDPDVFTKLTSTPNPNQLAGGGFVNSAALAKQASIRPGKK